MRVAVGDTDGRGEGVRDGVSATVIERDPSTVRVPAGLAVALWEVAVAVRGGGVETVPVGDVVWDAVPVAVAHGVAVALADGVTVPVALLEVAVAVGGGVVETVPVGDAVRDAVPVAAADGVAVADGVGVGVRKGEMRRIRSAFRGPSHTFVPSNAAP